MVTMINPENASLREQLSNAKDNYEQARKDIGLLSCMLSILVHRGGNSLVVNLDEIDDVADYELQIRKNDDLNFLLELKMKTSKH